MSSQPRVIIIGAGIVGSSIADELTERGWTDVTVLDQGPLYATGGSSSHAPGLVFQANVSKTMTDFAAYTVAKLRSLSRGDRWCFNPVGGLEVATSQERLQELTRRHGWLTSWGVESRLVDPDECARMHPLVRPDRVLGGFHIPSDGLAKAVRAVEVQAGRAAERGARFLAHHTVTGICERNGRVTGVETDRGTLQADIVVSAAGFWGPRIGRMVDLQTPLQPLAHQYARTTALGCLGGRNTPTWEASAPILRHQDRDLYFREHVDQVGIGSYGHRPLPVDPDEVGFSDTPPHMPSMLPFTDEDFAQAWEDSVALLPDLEEAKVEEGFNGVFSFTPDGMPLMGEHRDLAGFWVAEAVWVTHSAGVAKAMAEWLVDGAPATDVHGCDLYRFEDVQLSPSYVHDRGCQSFVEIYDVVHPLQPMEEPRPLRVSPFYAREQQLDAMFLEGGGWERPHWYEANASLPEVQQVPGRNEWAARYWSPVAGAEALRTRSHVALFDMTPLKRLEVTGPGAVDLLQRLTTNDVGRKPGAVTYTLLLDENGGIRSDLTVARLSRDHFQVGANGNLDLDRLLRHVPSDGSVQVRDITAGTCCVGVWGPRARDLVQPLTGTDFSHEAFGYFRARRAHLGPVPVTALRLSYVGELGWELYTTADLGLALWDLLWQAGQEHGVIAAGRSAFNSLRLEKGYRSAGLDMTTEHNPYEAGLGFAVRMDKGDFVGRSALREIAPADVTRRLVPLLLHAPEHVVLGHEPVYAGDRPVGYVTSAGYGYTIGRPIAYAWLPAEHAAPGTDVAVEYLGERLAASVAAEPLFDSDMARIRR